MFAIDRFRGLAHRLRKLLVILADPQLRIALLRWRVAPSVEHRAVLRGIGPLDTVFDVGANRGQFALQIRELFPTVQIIAFEPLHTPADRFDRVFESDEGVVLHRVALSDRDGISEFYESRRDDSSSLREMSAAQERIFPGTRLRQRIDVKCHRLANYVMGEPGQTLLKIDVQGAELQVLRGLGEYIRRIDLVYVEVSFIELYAGQPLAGEIVEYLTRFGFRLCTIGPVNQTRGVVVQADMLFTRSESDVEA